MTVSLLELLKEGEEREKGSRNWEEEVLSGFSAELEY